MQYSLDDGWIAPCIGCSRRLGLCLAALLVANKVGVWLRSRPTAAYRRFFAGRWLFKDGPGDAPITILFVPGQTEPAYGRLNTGMAHRLAGAGYRVIRFDFSPIRGVEHVQLNASHINHYCQQLKRTIKAVEGSGPVILLGKSFGGAIASLVLDDSSVLGGLAFGYPFVSARTSWDRLSHLSRLEKPFWIIQGTEDSYGGMQLVETLLLSGTIQICWIENCDHGFIPTSADGVASDTIEQLHAAIQLALLELLG